MWPFKLTCIVLQVLLLQGDFQPTSSDNRAKVAHLIKYKDEKHIYTLSVWKNIAVTAL